MRFKEFIEKDDFDLSPQQKGEIANKQRSFEKDKLALYHGFNADPQTFNYKFDPNKSEQGLLWFTHPLIRGYNPYEYAANRGDYVLTYPLDVVKHFDVIKYQNGNVEREPPEDLMKLAEPTENSRYMTNFDHVIELPQGWFFTYKSEKFIGTSNEITASPQQIKQVD